MAASFLNDCTRESVNILTNSYKFEYIQKLGCGTYGTVLSMYDRNRKKQVAVKIVTTCSRSELHDWIYLLHPNIVPLYNILNLSECGVIVFVMPSKNCTMLSKLNSESFCNHPQSFEFLRKWMYELLCGLNYLHCRHLYHLDIKLGNELLSDRATAMLSDFSFLTRQKEVILGQMGMPDVYRPPEIYLFQEKQLGQGRFDSEKLDLWAFGILCLEAFTKQALYKNPSRRWNDAKNSVTWRGWAIEVQALLIQIRNDLSYFSKMIQTAFPSTQFDDDLIALCQNCIQLLLCEDPNSRILTSKAMKHRFLKDYKKDLCTNLVI
ncbi:uncharacterized protein [Centruroides vittatus]|uniref:uncharacterized protein n=1 Tax=Centruroides vittatus TaxID=120091 RepID=UPI00351081BC